MAQNADDPCQIGGDVVCCVGIGQARRAAVKEVMPAGAVLVVAAVGIDEDVTVSIWGAPPAPFLPRADVRDVARHLLVPDAHGLVLLKRREWQALYQLIGGRGPTRSTHGVVLLVSGDQLVVQAGPDARHHLVLVLGLVAATHTRLTAGATAVAIGHVAIVALLASFHHAIATTVGYQFKGATVGRVAKLSSARITVIGAEHGIARNAGSVRADVPVGADVAIVTWLAVGRGDAPLNGVTVVIGADVAVVAGEHPRDDTLATGAVVTHCALIQVRAFRVIGQVNTAGLGAAGIVGARVVIVTGQLLSSGAGTFHAMVLQGAEVTVAARHTVKRIGAAIKRMATIGGAKVVVLAADYFGADAFAGQAGIGQGAGVAIVALPGEGSLLAARLWIANICGAGITVITLKHAAPQTLSQVAGIIGGAFVPVIAGSRIEFVDATLHRVTRICGTEVAVIAVQDAVEETGLVLAMIINGAGIAIIAAPVLGKKDTPEAGITAIVSAGVGIFAQQASLPRHTLTCNTGIPYGTDVAIAARTVQRTVDTANAEFTGIRGTRIAVVAVDILPGLATPIRAGVTKSARVPIVTRPPLVIRRKTAGTAKGVATAGQAGGIPSLGFGTDHDGVGVDPTLIGQF